MMCTRSIVSNAFEFDDNARAFETFDGNAKYVKSNRQNESKVPYKENVNMHGDKTGYERDEIVVQILVLQTF